MEKKAKKSAQTRPARERPQGLDRFAGPDKPAGGRPADSAAQPAASGPNRQGAKRPQTSGMTVRMQGSQRMTPQKQGVTQRPLAGERTGRDRALHLRRIVRRKERRARISKCIAAVLSLVCGVFALTAFFHIQEIDVVGLTRYEEQAVLDTFGVRTEDNLIFCDSRRGQKRLLAQYPYFEDVSVERDLPGRLVLHVDEAQPIAAVNGTQGGWFILDKNCRVLERTDQSGAQDTAEVMGLRTPGAEPGQTLPVEDAQALEALKTLARGLDAIGLGGKATLYNLEDLNSIWFLYEDRFAVCIGDTQDLEHKLAIFQALVTGDQFSPSDKGSINLALGDRAITNTSLSAGEIEKTARGQSTIQHIENQADEDEEADEEDEE